VPCLTVRPNTERPVTITLGTNILVGDDMALLLREARRVLDGYAKKGTVPPLWDGRAAERIVEAVVERSTGVAARV
jgi:UDP-N-acetylglucosamine 2-epimerase (non-hydrolysing)